jgi:protein-tyrosine phosphatase
VGGLETPQPTTFPWRSKSSDLLCCGTVTRYGLIFLMISLGFLAIASRCEGAAMGLLAWFSLGFSLLAAAYLLERPQLFGKRPNGTLAPWAVVVALPVVVLNYGLWTFKSLLREEPANHEVAPRIFVGRLPLPGDLPEGITAIVDVTSELIAHPQVRIHPGYRVYPMLDDGFVEAGELERIIAELVDLPGAILIHCAAGHGRSATLAAALGIARGHFADPEHAETAMRRVRPKIKLRRQQRERLAAWFGARQRI